MRRDKKQIVVGSPAGAFEDLRADYEAAKTSRFRRRRRGLSPTGSGADYHYRNESDYLKIMEYARDMDRNDMIVGQMVDRAVINEIQDGFTLDAQTGDAGVDGELEGHWKEWTEDKEQCDAAGEKNFHDIEYMSSRATKVDGDILALPLHEGCLELVEGHRLRTPSGTRRNVVCGVLLDERRRRLEYWLTRDDVDPLAALTRVADIKPYPARDAEGHRQVFQIYNPKRASQTRGVSALAPIFNPAGMYEDIQFAKLVQQQVVSCFAIFREMDAQGLMGIDPEALGALMAERLADGGTRTIEGLGPGMMLAGLPGEKLTGFSPNVPNQEFFSHMRMILQIVGVNLGLPLVLVLLDASETNFSGWRGAIDAARMGFRWNQTGLINNLHKPVYLWKCRQWIAEDPALARALARLGKKFFAHLWNRPKWPYIQPMQDAQAEALRVEKRLTSPRRMHAESGREWPEVANEIVEDNALIIAAAIAKAEELNRMSPAAKVDWRELCNFDLKGKPAPAAAPGPGTPATAAAA